MAARRVAWRLGSLWLWLGTSDAIIRSTCVDPAWARRLYVVRSGATSLCSSRVFVTSSPPSNRVTYAAPQLLSAPYDSHRSEPSTDGLAVPGVAVSRLSQRPGIRVGSIEPTIASEQSAFTLTRSS